MSNPFFIKCLKDTEGWSAAPMEYREDGSILYQVGGLDGEVIFEEAAQ
ncbi:hypothetical protein [Salmonella enterica]|nr:hypothetical protein [Salmonella enterica]